VRALAISVLQRHDRPSGQRIPLPHRYGRSARTPRDLTLATFFTAAFESPIQGISMNMPPFNLRSLTLVAGIALLTLGSVAQADPPSRVARLGYITGAVSFSPAGEDDWVQSTINRPLTTGDRLWADAGARAEIQVGGAMIRMSAGTGLSVLNLDDQITQLQLTQGTLGIRVRRLDANQVFEVATPNLAFTVRQPGDYRISVEPDGSATTIVVRRGQGEVYGEGASYLIDSRQPYRFAGTGLREYEYVDMPRVDDFDRWASARDRSYDNSASARFVSRDVVGYQDLDANGTWRVDATYGNVWFPTRVAAGWAPYRDGHWTWVDPWGWTWVDDAPWGFAVSHYGRWANLGGTWGWVPGPVRSNAYYAPALVAFVGGSNFQLSISSGNVGGVAWFPLGPRDVYRPSYVVSRGYFENVNRSNTVINNTVINNYYNNTNVTNVVYANQRVPGAVVAVPTTVFAQSQPVSRSAVRVSQQVVATAPVAVMPSVAPTQTSVRGAARPGDQPPQRTFERAVVARSAPPAAAVGFAAQQQQLAAKPGQPLDDNARRQLKPAAAAPAAVVRVVAPTQVAAPTAVPPAAAPGGRTNDARGRSDERNRAGAPPVAAAPAPNAAPTMAAPTQPVATPPEQRSRQDQRGNDGQRGQVAAPPAATGIPVPAPTAPVQAAPRQAAPAPAVAPQAAPRQAAPPQAMPPAAPQERRGNDAQRNNAEQRGGGQSRSQPAAPPSQPQRAPESRAMPPQPAPPAPSVMPPQAQPARPAPSSAAPPAPAARQAVPPVQAPPAANPRQPDQRAPVAAPQPAPPQPQPVPGAAPRNPDQQRGAGNKPDDRKKDADELKRDEENRKPRP